MGSRTDAARRLSGPASRAVPARMVLVPLVVSLVGAMLVMGAPAVGASGGIAFRAVSAGTTGAGGTALVLPRPAGVVAGDVMVAGINYRGSPTPTLTPPAGWSLVTSGDRMAVYSRVATASEPSAYTFGLSFSRVAVGAIAAYSGVDPASPVQAAGGQVNAASTRLTAPSVSTSISNAMLVDFFSAFRATSISPPRGAVRRVVRSSPAGSNAMTIAVADRTVPAAGSSGPQVASQPRAAASIGQTVALDPAGSSTPTPPGNMGTSPVYRAFTAASYWNTPLPPTAPVDPSSASFIAYMKKNIVGNFVMLAGADANGQWGTPIYWASAADPTYDVRSTAYALPPEFSSLRIPRGARPDPTSDAAMMVYDLQKGYVAGLWQARYDATADAWTASGGDIYYLGSNGLDGRLAQSDDPRNQGHRGAAPPIFAIRWDEVQAGAVDHVMEVTIPGPGSGYVFPMTGSDGHSTDPSAPPEGARLRLDPSIDLSKMNLTPAQYAVAKAAQDYGFVITDGSGAPVAAGLENVVAEGRGWLWNGVLAWDSLRMFPLDDYRFVQLGYGS